MTIRGCLSPLDECLAIWSEWHTRADAGIDWRNRVPILSSEAALDAEQLYARADTLVAEAVEAMVNSLSARHEAAIRHRCGHSRVWRFPQLDFTEVLPAAEAELGIKLRRNVATRSYFA